MLFASLPSSIRAKLAEFEREYRRAESALKVHEIEVLMGLVAPALNEFRYAGSHLSRIFADDEDTNNLDEIAATQAIDEGIRHLRRATYDAYDAALLFYLRKCDAFNREYKHTTVTTILPSFPDEQTQIDTIKNELDKEYRDKERRDKYVESKEQQYLRARDISQKWERYRSELNKERAKNLRSTLLSILGILITLAALLVALIK
ncbi:MAG: hypothetical protein LBP75_02910 [Planctomycetota bacterium]|jgi:hypothetical protein|nr:hypothetical protein [Planctomycetota bacterium]